MQRLWPPSIRGIEGGIASPLVGLAVDRFGARRLMLFGSIVSGLGFVLFSRIHSLPAFYGVFLFLSIGSSFCSRYRDGRPWLVGLFESEGLPSASCPGPSASVVHSSMWSIRSSLNMDGGQHLW